MANHHLRTVYCSSPALDSRLSRKSTIPGSLQPDPLVYTSPESLRRLYRNVAVVDKEMDTPPPLLQKQQRSGHSGGMNDMSAVREQVTEVDKDNAPSKGSRLFTTPPKKNGQQPAREGGEGDGDMLYSSPTTPKGPRFRGSPSHSPSPSPPKSSSPGKRKRIESQAAGSPSKPTRIPWNLWEEVVILKAVIAHGEGEVDWDGVLQEINAKRKQGEPRTRVSVKLHWSAKMKKQLLSE